MKQLIKQALFGNEARSRRIHLGLLKGRSFYVDPVGKSQRLLGLDEKEIESHVRRVASRARTAIDIGANDGWYTTFFASQANILKVIACDPNGAVTDLLSKNVGLNDLAAKVDLQPIFVGTAKESDHKSLDELLAKERSPFVMKIDVDGGELDVLSSGKTVLTEEECYLVVETHTVELERDCLRFLGDLGYQTTVVPNGWYRRFVPERRPIPHNRWFVAQKAR